mgnify:CR=1 FL=1
MKKIKKSFWRAYWKLHDKKKMLVARLKGYLDGLPPKTRRRIVLAMLAAFAVLALYTFGNFYVQIEPFKKRKAGKLSGGMKQKLALSCALIHRPDVLFLDEPTTGVDPVSRVEFWDMLDRLKRQGITIMVSTPYMDEASRCDRIALMRGGRCLSVDTPEGIRSTFDNYLYAVRSASMYKLLLDLRTYPDADSCFSFGDANHFSISRGVVDREGETAFRNRLHAFLEAKGHTKIGIERIKPGIEDCFMALENMKDPVLSSDDGSRALKVPSEVRKAVREL